MRLTQEMSDCEKEDQIQLKQTAEHHDSDFGPEDGEGGSGIDLRYVEEANGKQAYHLRAFRDEDRLLSEFLKVQDFEFNYIHCQVSFLKYK
eukprot:2720964-Amphidinium_carterae.1